MNLIFEKEYNSTKKIEILKNDSNNLFCIRIVNLCSSFKEISSLFLSEDEIKNLIKNISDKI